MIKKERIAQLEAEVKALKAGIALLAALRERVALLEARPITPWYVPAPNRYPPLGPFTLEMPQCTCGSTAGCLRHPGAISYSWDGSTLDANGHVQ